MFGTLLGALPRRPNEPGSVEERVAAAVGLQDEVGLEPVTDGRQRWPGFLGPLLAAPGIEATVGASTFRVAGLERPSRSLSVDGWRAAAGLTSRYVKQALPGPYSLARRAGAPPGESRTSLALDFAALVRAEVTALADAGCRIVEIEERDAHEIGPDERERSTFRAAHDALTDGLEGVHLSLAITGGNADTAGAETLLVGPYASLALDLIRGPDNWRLARAWPGERGLVAGALSTAATSDDGPELLLWAAAYAASMNGRGADRVGLGTAGGLGGLSWEAAAAKLGRLGEAVRLGSLPPDEASAGLDPRALTKRSAALGRHRPGARRRDR